MSSDDRHSRVYTIGFVALEIPRRANGYHADGSSDPGLEEQFASLPAALFPNTVELGTRPGEFVSDAQFAFGFARILDGMESSLRRATPPACCHPPIGPGHRSEMPDRCDERDHPYAVAWLIARRCWIAAMSETTRMRSLGSSLGDAGSLR